MSSKGTVHRLDARIWYNGKEYRKRETFSGGKKEAEERLHTLKKELRKKAESEPDSSLIKITTFGDALEYYYQVRKNNLVSPSAFERMRNDLGNVSIQEIKDCFRRYWLALRRTTSKQTGEFLANSTINHYTVMAKAALNMCVKDELLDKNPLQNMEILKVIPRDVTLSEIDQQKLLNVVDREAPHLSAIIRFALIIPCRKSELINLKRDDLDLFNMAVRVRHENAKGDNGSWKPIPEELQSYFKSLRSDTEYLFYRVVNGKPVKIGNFKKSFGRCLQLAGIKDWHFHDFRHKSATELLNAGNPEQVVCQIAGWKSGNMIRQYYHKDGLRAVRDVILPKLAPKKPDTQTGHLEAVN